MAETNQSESMSFEAKVIASTLFERYEDVGICNDSPDEFKAKVGKLVDQLITLKPHLKMSGNTLDLFSYGTVIELLGDPHDNTAEGFFLLNDAAKVLGWEPAKYRKWARQEYLHDLETQRDADVESGRIGWDRMQIWPAWVDVWSGEGKSDDHYDETGHMTGPVCENWTDLWFISTNRLVPMMMCSPRGREWFENARPMFSHAFASSGLEDVFKDVQTLATSSDGTATPTGRSLADAVADDRRGISEEEATRKAFTGPPIPRPALRLVRSINGARSKSPRELAMDVLRAEDGPQDGALAENMEGEGADVMAGRNVGADGGPDAEE